MTKRKAILAIVTAFFGGEAKAQSLTNGPSGLAGVGMPILSPEDLSIAVDLKSLDKFEFHYGDASVTLTGREIFEALRDR